MADIRTMFLQQTHCGGLAAGANDRCGGVTASEIGNKKMVCWVLVMLDIGIGIGGCLDALRGYWYWYCVGLVLVLLLVLVCR